MKKWIAMVCTLMLPLCAGAETLAQQIGASEQIIASFASNTGKTVISVDAEVFVPDAEQVPVYHVTPRFFTEDELKAMADTCFGAIPYDFQWEDQEAQAGSFSYISMEAQDGSNCYLYGTMWQNNAGVLQDVSATFENHRGDISSSYPTDRFSNVYLGNQPAGCFLSRDEARRIADAAVSTFAPGFGCVGQAIIREESTGGAEEYTEEYSGQEAWVLYYGKDLELPVTYDITIPNDPYIYVHRPETLAIVIDDLGIASMAFNSPYTLGGKIEENCALLPFDQIMSVAEKLMPLKIASSEAYYADIRIQITEIRLGYMYTLHSNAPGEYILTPVWDFIGTVQYRERKDGAVTAESNEPFQSFLTLSAIDGTVIDRNYGY